MHFGLASSLTVSASYQRHNDESGMVSNSEALASTDRYEAMMLSLTSSETKSSAAHSSLSLIVELSSESVASMGRSIAKASSPANVTHDKCRPGASPQAG